MSAPIDVSDFRDYFSRDFTFGTSVDTVTEADVTRAIAEANTLFNAGLFTAGEDLEIAFQQLTAHVLVRNIQAAGGLGKKGRGVRSSGRFAISSKSAGPASVSYQLPADLADNPVLSGFLTTDYGQRYLQMVVPLLVGNFGIAAGGTQP